MSRLASILITSSIACHALLAQPTNKVKLAPGGPGKDAHWPSAAKNGFGTSTSLQSKVWFTLNNGVMTEAFYPTLDTPNTESLRFKYCQIDTCYDEAEDMTHSLRVLDSRSLTFQQVNTASNFSITKTYSTDSERSAILIEVNISSSSDATSTLYVYFDPSLKNSGMHDTAWNGSNSLLASESNVASALISSSGFEQLSSTFAGVNDQPGPLNAHDGWERYDRAENGNVVQIGKVRNPRSFTLVLGFGATVAEALATAQTSLRKGFSTCRSEYEAGWHAYLSSLRRIKTRYSSQLNMAAMVLKALEDKTYRGAMIASPSSPWGGGPNANEATVSGYHAVWSRDLYQVATALAGLGDLSAAKRALNHLFKVQQLPNGSFPQNSWIDGRPIGGGVQLDEVAWPIVLAFQLGHTDQDTWRRHIKPAADFITINGPVTGQDRWEEKAGYSPATIAAEIAALVCAARVAQTHRDFTAADTYLRKADEWENNLAHWTVTTTGPMGDGNYFLRLTEEGNPNKSVEMEINSGGGHYDQRSIVDLGFLELVRLGIRSPEDVLIRKSLDVVDKALKIDTPIGPGWYRYNHDAYGERLDGKPYDGRSGVGRLWTLLTGERGEYELASGRTGRARVMLAAMAGFANDGLMIPEQVWDRSEVGNARFSIGQGTGSATPLAWSMAQFIRLSVNINRGRNAETPDIVRARYGRRPRMKN
jgi:glucoamylase